MVSISEPHVDVVLLCALCRLAPNIGAATPPGRYGFLILQDGSEYVGSFAEGRCSGYGVLTLPDKRQYEGRFEDNNLATSAIHTP